MEGNGVVAAEEHEMTLVRAEEDGTGQWHCRRCGRQILLQMSPAFRKTVLVPGDERAIHTGAQSGTPSNCAPGGLRLAFGAQAFPGADRSRAN